MDTEIDRRRETEGETEIDRRMETEGEFRDRQEDGDRRESKR